MTGREAAAKRRARGRLACVARKAHQAGMSFADDMRACIQFWSRLPVPGFADAPDLRVALRALPAASLVIAAPAAAALALGCALGLSPLLAALVALGVMAATTGGFHEDGFADCADAMGGYTRERRLDIMRDSRIGSFGGLALVFSVGIRAVALATLAEQSVLLACVALFACAAIARVAGLTPLALLPPARETGFGKDVAAPDRDAHRLAIVGAVAAAILPMLAGAGPGRAILALAGAFGAALAWTPFARARFGGQTGDVAGAAEQFAEMAYLALLSTAVAA